MVKLLIVDDEELLLYGYRNAIEWEKNDIEIVGMAENGLQALDIIKAENPDIVMTDVVMPKMDGIELSARLKKDYPHIKMIIMSGHDEFEYARSAIENKVSKYLLKPVRVELILEEVLRLKSEIENEKKLQRHNEIMQKKLMESLPLLRTQYMNTLLNSDEPEEAAIKEKLNYLDINLSPENISVMVMQLDNYAHRVRDLKPEEFYALYIEIKDICSNVIGSNTPCFIFEDRQDNIVVINNCPKDMQWGEGVKFVSELAVEIQNEINNTLGETVSIGIGEIKNSLNLIGEAYDEGISALEHKFFMGNNSVIFIRDVHAVADYALPYPYQLEDEIIKSIKMGDFNNASNNLDLFFDNLRGNRDVARECIYQMASILINSIYSSLIRIDSSASESFNKSLLKIMADFHEKEIETLTDIVAEFKKVFYLIVDKINTDRDMRKNSLMQSAIEFIHSNISNDVSLQTVADAVFISPNYLSYLFKENFDESFKDYVIRIRVEKAQELLMTTDYKVKQIAEHIGYNDWRYFTRVFKKLTGKTPEEFKENKQS